MNFTSITNEPTRMTNLPGCPPGLEYLTQLDKIKVEQLVSLTEAFIGFERNNKYVLRNSNDEQFLYAFEGNLCQLISSFNFFNPIQILIHA